MLMIANLLALSLVVADEPKTSTAPPAPMPGAADRPEAGSEWRLSLPEAIRIGLRNSEVIRVVSEGGTPNAGRAGVVIAQANADASTWNFKAAVMAHLRSIEQQYWALADQRVAVSSREAAVKLVEEILNREKAERDAGRSDPARVAEVEQQLENSKLNLITATSDLITTERQLRDLLGLPADDHRRIVPETAPVEARLEPDWEASLRAMNDSRPEIAQQQALVRLTELRLLLARNRLLTYLNLNSLYQINGLGRLGDQGPPMTPGIDPLAALTRAVAEQYPAGLDLLWADDLDFTHQQVGVGLAVPSFGPGRAPLANTRQAQYQLLGQRAALQQVIHQATHSLARSFLEVDSQYKQFQAARRLRADAQDRLKAQRAAYEEGKVTVDRLLDAIGQHATAVAQEAQFKYCYNTAIAALEEAKGTLLAHDGITVADHPTPAKPGTPPGDDRVAPAAFQVPAPAAATAQPATSSYKLRAKLGGIRMWEFELEISHSPTAGTAR